MIIYLSNCQIAPSVSTFQTRKFDDFEIFFHCHNLCYDNDPISNPIRHSRSAVPNPWSVDRYWSVGH